MYSRYLPPEEAFFPLPPEEPPEPPPAQKPSPARPAPCGARPSAPKGPAEELLGGLTQELNKLLGGLFRFSLEDLDTGDILLFLIVLFLFLEGDDIDLAIALGLTLLLSLGEQRNGPTPPADTAPSHQEG